tara:strand:+ start:832 stop:1407 length:576 start_codon:yes stop_codon:yes gene_type:complete
MKKPSLRASKGSDLAKSLILMRHAKSSWDNSYKDDFDRPLNSRGKENAQMVAKHIHSLGFKPELTLCSSAARCKQTLELIIPYFPTKMHIRYLDELYLAPERTILEMIKSIELSINQMLVIGHNPGLSDLSQSLIYSSNKKNDYFETQQFPTSAASIFEMSINNWLNLKLSDSKIIDFVTPKKLMEKNLNS